MRYIFFVLLAIFSYSYGMQQPVSFALHTESSLRSRDLAEQSNAIGILIGSLWRVKGLLVRYENNKDKLARNEQEQKAFDCHSDNIKKKLKQFQIEFEIASKALCNYDLVLLTQHIPNLKLFYRQLHHEADHFQQIIEKRLPGSKM